MLESVWRNGNLPILLLGMQIGVGSMNNNIEVPKKLKIELLCDPATPILGIYPKKTLIQKGKCNKIFTAALFMIAKTWNQPKCPSADEWIKKMWGVCVCVCVCIYIYI